MTTLPIIDSTNNFNSSAFEQIVSTPSFLTASNVSAVVQEPIFLKIAVQATAKDVRVSFDPVSVEDAHQTRNINKSVRLGFVPPASSTRG
jgi:hypothetical protein